MKLIFSLIKFLIPLIVAVILLYFAFRQIDFNAFLIKAKEANYGWVIASIFVSLISYAVRAYRWNMLIKPLYPHVSTFRTTLAVLIGYLANLAFPRLGEVTRCATLKKIDNVPITVSLGTVITERIVDMISLLILLALSFILEFERINLFFSEIFEKYHINFKGIFIVGLVILLVLITLIYVFSNAKNKFILRIKSKIIEVYSGLKSIKNLKNKSLFLLLTVLLWFSYFMMSYLIVFSLEETAGLSVSAGFMLLVTGGIALALPVQGGIGTYHAMVSSMLVLYGIDNTTGLFLATLLHTSQIIAVAFFGGLAVLITLLISRKNSLFKQ